MFPLTTSKEEAWAELQQKLGLKLKTWLQGRVLFCFQCFRGSSSAAVLPQSTLSPLPHLSFQ